MKFSAYFLKFNTPLHISDYKPDSYESSESFLRSDTIIAAIISAWATLGHTDWIGDGITPFTISSAFPFFGDEGKETIFFPRLKMAFNMQDRDTTLSKKIKKVTWLDQIYFEKVLNNQEVNENLEKALQSEFIATTTLPTEGFMYKQVSERVAIPRERNDENQSKPFYMERIYFTNGGLYFLVSGDELNKLEAALNFLQYEGFGTDRNVGNGFFKWHRKEISLNVPTGSAYSACLGLYCPTDKTKVQLEVNDKSSYELVKRGGWITTPGYQTIEKNSIYMFTEGSIFYKKDHIDGKGNIDLTPATLPIEMKPSHPIYRCGRTLFIPVKLLHYE